MCAPRTLPVRDAPFRRVLICGCPHNGLLKSLSIALEKPALDLLHLKNTPWMYCTRKKQNIEPTIEIASPSLYCT